MSIFLIVMPILASCGKTETTTDPETSTVTQITEEINIIDDPYVMIYDSDNILYRTEFSKFYESLYDFENHPEVMEQLGVDTDVFSRSYTIPSFNMIYDKYQNEIQDYFISIPKKYRIDMNNLDTDTEVCNVTYEITNISSDVVSMNITCEYYKKDDNSKYKIYTETLDLSSEGVFNITLKNKE